MVDYFEGKATAVNCSLDEESILIGDEKGFVYILSSDSFDCLCSLKSMGFPISFLATDDISNLIICYDRYVSIFDKSQKPVQNFNIDIAKLGNINYFKSAQNLIILGTESSNFVLLDSVSGKELSVSRAKNWSISSRVSFLRSESGSIRNIGGTDAGHIFIFDIN